MQKFKSHKVVSAGKIVADFGPLDGPGVQWLFEVEGGEGVVIPTGRLPKETTAVGGYAVIYDDGFTSWSPAEAFESGYTAFDPERPHTPPPVIGYRSLSAAEVELMNRIKLHGSSIEALLVEVNSHLGLNSGGNGGHTQATNPHRWISIAMTHFQQGVMALTRAVAQPTGF